jgi:hypothetical protein
MSWNKNKLTVGPFNYTAYKNLKILILFEDRKDSLEILKLKDYFLLA